MASDQERTDGELLAAVAAGDGVAFAVFYRRHLPGVVGYFVRQTGDREASADLAAEVCRRRGRVEDRARRRLGLEPEVWDDADLARVDELAGAGALELVDRLPERQRVAVRSRVVEERGYAEIARELECSELVVRQQVSRGLKRLRAELTEGER
jgi:DNA-directed RNA polymerase specialized sigma24 family protein